MAAKLRIVHASILMVIMLAAIGTASAATVNVVPSSQNAAPGATFSVNVIIDSGSDNLHAAHVELNYDINVLTNVSLTPGSLIGSAILNEPGNGVTPGKVMFGAARISGNPAVPVNGTFITVEFQVKSSAQEGTSVLDLVAVNLKSSATITIPSPEMKDGQVTVTGQGTTSSSTSTPSSSSASPTSTPSTTAAQKPTGADNNTAKSNQTSSAADQPAKDESRHATSGFEAVLLVAVLLLMGKGKA